MLRPMDRPWTALSVVLMLSSFALAGPEGLSWTKYENNPVIATASRGQPCVMMDDGVYKMWLGGHAEGIFYSTSLDGLSWSEPVTVLPTNTYANWSPSVIKEGNAYKMWYRAHNGGGHPGDSWIEYATSPDGVNWTRQGTVLTAGASGSFDSYGVYAPKVLHDADGYKMWYGASDGTSNYGTVGLATSDDGVIWTKRTEPVLLPDGVGYDSSWVRPGGVYAEDGRYYLLVCGGDETAIGGRLGLAWSDDGITFTRTDDPILDLGTAGSWDDYSTGAGPPRGGASMMKVGEDYWVWYTGQASANEYRIAVPKTPEPATCAVLALGVLVMLGRRRTR